MYIKVECSNCGATLGAWKARMYIKDDKVFVNDYREIEGLVEGDSRDPNKLYIRCSSCGAREKIISLDMGEVER